MEIALDGYFKDGYYYSTNTTRYYFNDIQTALRSEINKKCAEEHGGLPVYTDKKNENLVGYAYKIDFKDNKVSLVLIDPIPIENHKIGLIIRDDSENIALDDGIRTIHLSTIDGLYLYSI